MSTFVELAQDMRRQAGLSGAGPADVTTAIGIELRLVNYIRDAWTSIQNHPKPWKWMWQDYSIPSPGSGPLQTIASVTDYQLTDCGRIWTGTFRSYLTATGTSDRQRMRYVDFESFQQRYGVVTPSSRRPVQVTRIPNGSLRFYPPPNDIYSIEFECQKTPQILAANDDIPEMPAHYHALIVFEALKRFGKAEDAPEIIKLAEEEGGSEGGEARQGNATGMWRQLIWDQEMRRVDDPTENPHMVVRAQ
ncbi:MAG: hypothetical protein OEN02_03170 [Gammaproteobacteria bacterium]|nr:hypothetical protein [Gammaproteobacteria bacterium]MDH3467814.1 hypothetical protein [Gammaproteobacteria bacterium]